MSTQALLSKQGTPSVLTVFQKQSNAPVNFGGCPGGGFGWVWRRTLIYMKRLGKRA